MHIKVMDAANALCREVDVFVDVVYGIDNHVIPADTSTVSATRGNLAISYDFKSCTVTTPTEYAVKIKDWKDSRYRRRIPVNNRRALGEWLMYEGILLVFGNVGVSADSRQNKLEIYINEGMDVLVDGKRIEVK